MAQVQEYISLDAGGRGQPTINLAGGSVASQSAVIGVAPAAGINVDVTSIPVTILASAKCWGRISATNNATADGTDFPIPAGVLLHSAIPPGSRFSFNSIVAGTVDVYQGS